MMDNEEQASIDYQRWCGGGRMPTEATKLAVDFGSSRRWTTEMVIKPSNRSQCCVLASSFVYGLSMQILTIRSIEATAAKL